jgi:hypothetical protein
MPGKSLDHEKIAETAEQLSKRIGERFPNAGLYRISQELLELGSKARIIVPVITKPIYTVRIAVVVLIAIITTFLVSLFWAVFKQFEQISDADVTDLVGTLEAGTNELVLTGLAILFLVNLETRIKRSRAIAAIHELRSIAHVIDMHQLSKDPAYYRKYSGETKSSPERELTLPELIRYLDYCSELLAITSKTAAIYVHRLNDAVVLAAVSDVKSRCTGLSGKIWQKLQIAQSIVEEN